jgi:hypothetical protein
MSYRHCLSLSVALLIMGPATAVELTGRFSMLGATAQGEAGDWGYSSSDSNTFSADQQSLRLMADGNSDNAEWSAHLRSFRLHSHGLVTTGNHSSSLFRYTDLGDELLDESDATSSTTVRYELDRLYYRRNYKEYTLSVGRQAIDWGSGRFWQPLNVFGSFSPTDLDTDYKPGIDVLNVDYFPSPYSTVTAVYAFAPEDQSTVKNSGALHYRRQVGELSEIAMVAGSITGNTVFGGSFESAWKDIGWRIEGLHYSLRESDETSLFWIAGFDYQFDDGTLLSVEYYDNSRGAMSETALANAFSDELIATGLQQQLSRQLKPTSGSAAWSHLHQLNLSYSVSDESDLLASLLLPGGKGLTLLDEPQSEFGHIPMSIALRLRFYF